MLTVCYKSCSWIMTISCSLLAVKFWFSIAKCVLSSTVDCQCFYIESELSAVYCWLWSNFENGADCHFLIVHSWLSYCQGFAIQSLLSDVHCQLSTFDSKWHNADCHHLVTICWLSKIYHWIWTVSCLLLAVKQFWKCLWLLFLNCSLLAVWLPKVCHSLMTVSCSLSAVDFWFSIAQY